jgi:hypothetical protein
MARLHLVHWDPAAAPRRRQDLVALGHDVSVLPIDGPALLRALRGSPPDAFVIDLSRSPAKGRDVGWILRRRPATRAVPLVFVDGEPAKVAGVRERLPDATFASWRSIGRAVAAAIAHPVAAPAVPAAPDYSTRSVAQKLGIKAGQRVTVLGAPPGAADLLAPLPDGVRLTARPVDDAALVLWFVRTADDLQHGLARVAADVGDRVVWMIWRKQSGPTGGAAPGVNGNSVREAGLAAGLVDFKICAVDATWSAMAFKRRGAVRRPSR